MTEREAYLVFNLLPDVGPAKVRRLVEAFGSGTAALAVSRADLLGIEGIAHHTAAKIAGWEDAIDLDRELRRIDEIGATVLTWDDPTYPPALREIYAPPLVLYVQGELLPRDRHAIAVVGSRRTTTYGIGCARKLSFQLAHAGFTVVSGLARGIDTAAHEAAVAAGGRTIAVLGSGMGKLYPPDNAGLASRIADGYGAVVSEFPIDCPPDKQTFPLRNRIVAGWGQGVLVVEAPRKSGALITANQALECDRSVFAVPGPIDRSTSQGTNALIQAGAKLVADVSDVLDELGSLFAQPAGLHAPVPDAAPAAPDLSGDAAAVYDALGDGECAIDALVERTGLTSSVVSTTLLRLEMRRLVKQLPGTRFVRLV